MCQGHISALIITCFLVKALNLIKLGYKSNIKLISKGSGTIIYFERETGTLWCRSTKVILRILLGPRWQQIGWELHKLPPRTKLELQTNYRKIILNKQLKTSWREAL